MKKLSFFTGVIFFSLFLFCGTAPAECVKTVEEGEWENPSGKQEVLRVIIEHPCKEKKKAQGEAAGEEEVREPAFSLGPDWIVTVYGKAFWTFPPRSWDRSGAVSAGFGEGGGLLPDGRLQATGGDRYIYVAYKRGAMRKFVFIKIAEDKEDTIEVKLSQQEDEGDIGKPESFFLKRKK